MGAFRVSSWLAIAVFCLPFTVEFQPLALVAQEVKPSVLSAPLLVRVDATDAPRKILHTQVTIPVQAGPVTLLYPKWIPGEHQPSGPINSLVNLRLSVNGESVTWQRDPLDMYAIHCRVPAGASELIAAFDYVSLDGDRGGYSVAAAATAQLAMIQWNQVVLYPSGFPTDQISVRASLRVPASWKFGTALPVEKSDATTADFRPVSLTTLVDSPVVTGAFYRSIPLTAPGARPAHEIDAVADSSAALALPDEQILRFKQLVAEAGALFGATHYERYHFLVALSGFLAYNGLEHHESSLNTESERAFIDQDERDNFAGLLPHEFVHSWNGKYRRPASLTTPDYQTPMQDDLLWVYEGLTEYLGGFVLTARAGLRDTDLVREWLAFEGMTLDQKLGRHWRPLQDTATGAPLVYSAPGQWADLRRSADFYRESMFFWLEADTLIRQQTGGQKSMDDFCRAFHGVPGGPPMVRTYTFEDVVNGLEAVAPMDWRAFLRQRLDSLAPGTLLNGLTNAGWKPVFNHKPNKYQKLFEGFRKLSDFRFSLGLTLKEDGTVADVLGAGLPAASAGISPGMKLVAVNGRVYSAQKLKDALEAAAAPGTPPLELLMLNDDYYKTYSIDYHGGERYPHLERDVSKPDLLEAICKPLTPKMER